MNIAARLGDRIDVPDRKCGYMAYPRAPRCDQFATVHALVDVDSKGYVGMASCDAHRNSLYGIGWIRGMHTFGPGCAHPVTTWDGSACLPGM